MAWTEITREQYRRDELRYASDTRAGEWAQIAPFLPARGRLGRPRERDLRTIVDAILYLLWTGCQWRGRPPALSPPPPRPGEFLPPPPPRHRPPGQAPPRARARPPPTPPPLP